MADSTQAAIRSYLTAGLGIGKIARTLGVGGSTVQRVKREMAAGSSTVHTALAPP